CLLQRHSVTTLLPYTTLFRSWRAHTVDLHDDEAELRERLRVASRRRKRAAADASALWTGVDLIDDRISDRRIEMRGLEEQSVKIDRKSTRLNSSHVKISYAVF